MCITTRSSDLRACDTGEINCLVCIGRDKCSSYPSTIDSQELAKTHYICLECQAYLKVGEVCNHTENTFWFSVDYSSLLKHASNIEEFMAMLETDENMQSILFNKVAELTVNMLEKEAAAFPFRSGYNLSTLFKDYKTEILGKLKDRKVHTTEELYEVVINFDIMKRDLDLFNEMYQLPTDENNEVFAYYKEKIKIYKRFLDHV